jgi:DNA-binding XRE family transcriptional regulator
MSKKVSKQERERRQHQAARDRDRLLYTRNEVARLFGVSIATIIRIENDGRLSSRDLGSLFARL